MTNLDGGAALRRLAHAAFSGFSGSFRIASASAAVSSESLGLAPPITLGTASLIVAALGKRKTKAKKKT